MSDLTELEQVIHHCLRGESGAMLRAELQATIEAESFDAEPLQTAYKEGQRAFARKLLTAYTRVEQGDDA